MKPKLTRTKLFRCFLYNLNDRQHIQGADMEGKNRLTRCPAEGIVTLDELAGLRHTRTLVACSPDILSESGGLNL